MLKLTLVLLLAAVLAAATLAVAQETTPAPCAAGASCSKVTKCFAFPVTDEKSCSWRAPKGARFDHDIGYIFNEQFGNISADTPAGFPLPATVRIGTNSSGFVNLRGILLNSLTIRFTATSSSNGAQYFAYYEVNAVNPSPQTRCLAWPIGNKQECTRTVSPDAPFFDMVFPSLFTTPFGDQLRISAKMADGFPLPAQIRVSGGSDVGVRGRMPSVELPLKVTATDDSFAVNTTAYIAVIAHYAPKTTCEPYPSNSSVCATTVPRGVRFDRNLGKIFSAVKNSSLVSITASDSQGFPLPAMLRISSNLKTGVVGVRGTLFNAGKFDLVLTASDGIAYTYAYYALFVTDK
jgi:hypothetical protein